jgi:hypothetical protein
VIWHGQTMKSTVSQKLHSFGAFELRGLSFYLAYWN